MAVVIAETELQMVRRHVAEGERHVREQREIVEQMIARRQDTSLAKGLLANFESLLEQHRAHLARITSPAPQRPRV